MKIQKVASDRRAHDRYALRTELRIATPDGRHHVGHMLDIGKGGMALVVDFNAVVGMGLLVQARLPVRPKGNAIFEARATVANCVLAPSDGGFRIGVQFGALDAQARDVLASCLP